jgi:hypothetical protein
MILPLEVKKSSQWPKKECWPKEKEKAENKPDEQLDYIEKKSIDYLHAHFNELDPKDKIILARMFLARRLTKRTKGGSDQLDVLDALSNNIRYENNNGGNGDAIRI